jgi:hypothetical protein
MLAESPGEHAAGLQQGYEISREISRSFQSSMQNNESGDDAFDLMAVAAGQGYLDKATLLIPLEVSTMN